MKVFIPRNISGWRFNMSVTIGPATISVVQLLLVAAGIWLSLWVRNKLTTSNVDKLIAFMLVFPILLLFIFIAFFKFSELTLIPFIAKMVRTYFLDTTVKFQINRDRPDPHGILMAKIRQTWHDYTVELKNLHIDKEKLKKLNVLTEQD